MQEAYWISMLSGLLGTIVGAATSWFVTKSSINQQHQNQKELVKEQESKANLTAIKSVLSEVEYNVICLNSIKTIMGKLNMDFINYKESNITSPIKNNKWDKHSDVLESVLTSKQMNTLVTFYVNLSVEIHNQVFNSERLEKLIRSGLTCTDLLKEAESTYSND